MKRNILILFILGLVSLSIILWTQRDLDRYPLNIDSGYTQENLDSVYSLFDLGVADINQDTYLDIYSANHNARQIFDINQQGQGFENKIYDLGFPQNYEVTEQPVSDLLLNRQDPGLYIYWHNYQLTIAAQNLSNPEDFSGLVIVPLSATPVTSGDLSIKINDTNALSGGLDKVRLVNFQIKGNGRLSIAFPASYPFFPPFFKLNSESDLTQVYIDSNFGSPPSHDFSLPPINALPHMDRHGMAWNDYDNDGNLDVVIVRGGMVGKMPELAPNATDELMLQTRSGFEDIAEQVGLEKQGCAARQVAWVDFDQDNLLDLYTMCGRHWPPNSLQANQLYRQISEGRFIDLAQEKNLAMSDMGWFVWLDVDNDRDMDLFWADETTFWLYRNQAGTFVAEELGQEESSVNQLAIADYDNDGDLDLFAASRKGSVLFTNNQGEYTATDPESIGLPSRAFAANWVDYDNDGLTDLYTLRYGMYRQRPNHTFEKINLLQVNSPKTFGGYAYCTWFDADNDGDRDLLIGKSEEMSWWEKQQKKAEDIAELSKSSKSKVLLYRNPGNENHWLQIELKGAAGNTVAIGGKVKVITENGTQFQQVGQADGAWRSQGHYRLYFGLGQQDKVESIQVTWPNGKTQDIPNPEIDKLLIIQQV